MYQSKSPMKHHFLVCLEGNSQCTVCLNTNLSCTGHRAISLKADFARAVSKISLTDEVKARYTV